MTIADLNARDATEAKIRQQSATQASNLINDDGGISDEEWAEQDRQIDKALKDARARNSKIQQMPNSNLPDRNLNVVNEENECCLCGRVSRFCLISAVVASVISLIAGLILGTIGALIGFCSVLLVGSLIGLVTSRYTEGKQNLVQ